MLEQLRFAIYDLRLRSEEHTPFIEPLERLVDEHRAMMGSCEIQLDIGDGVPAGLLGVKGGEVLRILGEALTNARRHAVAQRVRVRVWGSNDGLSVEVSDDGRGFDTASPASPIHRGITGMRERAELLNGRLEIHSEPGVGTNQGALGGAACQWNEPRYLNRYGSYSWKTARPFVRRSRRSSGPIATLRS